MSATDQVAARPSRTRTLRDDLLDDLRQAAPMPVARPARGVPVPIAAVPGTAESPLPAPAEAPTLELAVTPRLWWGLRMKTLGEGPGVVIGAGPVRISLTGFRR
ncbi:hypothetical protein [Blastococcus sp. CT_GayMR16]|uniref:hypothetical protein n=1 Tax=Blastococcus sp. CT_GayMR16 TaxID=2559607 RepID=UPI0010731F72|nr:hypothetical protein [Blastococcus sp. CT_GayMR16]TFV86978.1 hypothetical protein E4P38_15160 [Blastococcus sp. CT_GayMR16]